MPPKAPPETVSVRLAAHEAPEVTRLIELRSEQKLRELVTASAEEFRVEDAAVWKVFASNKPWDRASEWAHEGRGRHAKLRELGMDVGARFLLVVFDGTNERWFRGEVTSRGIAEAGTKYPRVTERVGEAPDPFAHLDGLFGFGGRANTQHSNEDFDEDEDESEDGEDDERAGADDSGEHDAATEASDEPDESLFEPASEDEARVLDRAAECARAWDAHFERDDAVDSVRPREQVERDLEAARELARQFGANPQRLDALLADREEPVNEWLDMLLFDLEDHQMFDPAIELADALAGTLGPADAGVTRAQLLLSAGRRDESLAQLERTTWEFPNDPPTRARAARVFRLAGDNTRAEDLARAVLDVELDEADESAYASAFEVLEEILRESGRGAEADQLAHSDRVERGRAARDADDDDAASDVFGALESMLSAESSAVRKSPPRAGRNDPCPCGSGKKYRDCHGATQS